MEIFSSPQKNLWRRFLPPLSRGQDLMYRYSPFRGKESLGHSIKWNTVIKFSFDILKTISLPCLRLRITSFNSAKQTRRFIFFTSDVYTENNSASLLMYWAAHGIEFSTLGGLQLHPHMAATPLLIIRSSEKTYKSAYFGLLQTCTAAAW